MGPGRLTCELVHVRRGRQLGLKRGGGQRHNQEWMNEWLIYKWMNGQLSQIPSVLASQPAVHFAPSIIGVTAVGGVYAAVRCDCKSDIGRNSHVTCVLIECDVTLLINCVRTGGVCCRVVEIISCGAGRQWTGGEVSIFKRKILVRSVAAPLCTTEDQVIQSPPSSVNDTRAQ